MTKVLKRGSSLLHGVAKGKSGKKNKSVKKQKKRERNLKSVTKTCLSSNVVNFEPKSAVCSDSEPELINPEWDINSQSSKDDWSNSEPHVHPNDCISTNSTVTKRSSASSDHSFLNEGIDSAPVVEGESGSAKKHHFLASNKVCAHDTVDSRIESKCALEVKSADSMRFNWTNESLILNEIKSRAIDLTSRTLHVSPIPPNCTFHLLKNLSPTMTTCRLAYNNNKKVLRQYAFLQYADQETAYSARKSIAGRLLGGKIVCAEQSHLPFTNDISSERVDKIQLFITNFDSSVSKSTLCQLFPKSKIDYPVDKNNTSLGYAIGTFVNEAVACESFASMHKRIVHGLPLFVNYMLKPDKKDMPKPKRPPKASLNSSTGTPAFKIEGATIIANSSNEVKAGKIEDITNKVDSAVTLCKPKVLVKGISSDECDSDSDSVLLASTIALSEEESETEELLIHRSRRLGASQVTDNVLNSIVFDKETSDTLMQPPNQANATTTVHPCGDNLLASSELQDEDNLKQDFDKESEESDTNSGSSINSLESDQDVTFDEDESKIRAEEDIDNDLMTILRAKRQAMKALKSAGTKRKWNYVKKVGNGMKNHQKSNQPSLLHVPKIPKKRR